MKCEYLCFPGLPTSYFGTSEDNLYIIQFGGLMHVSWFQISLVTLTAYKCVSLASASPLNSYSCIQLPTVHLHLEPRRWLKLDIFSNEPDVLTLIYLLYSSVYQKMATRSFHLLGQKPWNHPALSSFIFYTQFFSRYFWFLLPKYIYNLFISFYLQTTIMEWLRELLK